MLPTDVRNTPILRDLFGNMRLKTYPFSLPGFTYELHAPIHEHYVHLGFRYGKLIVQACYKNSQLELLDPTIFTSPTSFDLPEPLISDSTHWLDVRAGTLEIRRKPHTWNGNRIGNFHLDFHRRTAKRNNSILVDPYSHAFDRIKRAFANFEDPKMLIVTQHNSGFVVDLRRLELSFVSRKGSLFSKQLHAEIDQNQDAGCLYGLESKIFLRDVQDHTKRSIITPLGHLKCGRRGVHMSVRVQNDGVYGRFAIDNILGRLASPPDPDMLYAKAEFHAITSFVLPDPLTGRTGTEEALHCLRSGVHQPWKPILSSPMTRLLRIANVTPRREYYPLDLRCQQRVLWNPKLTTYIQSDEFRTVVKELLDKSKQLALFFPEKSEQFTLDPEIAHLRLRANYRSSLYEYPTANHNRSAVEADIVYASRDHGNSDKMANVHEIVSCLVTRPKSILSTKDLAGELSTGESTGGYDETYHGSIDGSLNVNLVAHFGVLANLCLRTSPDALGNLIFDFAIIAFPLDVKMSLLRSIISFALFDDFRLLKLPAYPSFVRFLFNERPAVEAIYNLFKDDRDCFKVFEPETVPEHASDAFGRAERVRVTMAIKSAEKQHHEWCKQTARKFARALVGNWPSKLADTDLLDAFEFSPLLVDECLTRVQDEWDRLLQNHQFSEHIICVQRILDEKSGPSAIETFNYTARKCGCIDVPKREPFQLLRRLRQTSEPQAQLINYIAPVTKRMIENNSLMCYSYPAIDETYEFPFWIELGIYAGRLYFPYTEYVPLQNYLNEATGSKRYPLGRKPLQFLLDFLASRRHASDFTHTPMGFLCQDRPLREDHPFFIKEKVIEILENPAEASRQVNGTGPATQASTAHAENNEEYDSDESYYDAASELSYGDAEDWQDFEDSSQTSHDDDDGDEGDVELSGMDEYDA